MKKLLITGLMTIVALAGVITAPTTVTAEVEQLRMSWGLPVNEASTNAIPVEEAEAIGRNALVEFFGADFSQLGDFTLEMGYNPAFNMRDSWLDGPVLDFTRLDGSGQPTVITFDCLPDDSFPMNVYRSTWVGTVSVPTDRTPCPDGRMLRGTCLFRFTIDAQTGELVGLQYFPSEDPVARPNMPSECMGTPIQIFEYVDDMTAQHNVAFANHAMQWVEESGIFEGEVLRAALVGGGWRMGRNNSFELVVNVAVESVDGESVMLTFQGRDRKEFVDLSFDSRRVDHALDREGNITQPTSQFVGNFEITNWIYS